MQKDGGGDKISIQCSQGGWDEKVINLNPKMSEEKELQEALNLLKKRKNAEAVGDNSVIFWSIQW